MPMMAPKCYYCRLLLLLPHHSWWPLVLSSHDNCWTFSPGMPGSVSVSQDGTHVPSKRSHAIACLHIQQHQSAQEAWNVVSFFFYFKLAHCPEGAEQSLDRQQVVSHDLEALLFREKFIICKCFRYFRI